MQSITFAVPTLATTAMSKADQMDIVLNQATASIICSYLEHMNKAIEKGYMTQTGATAHPAFIGTTELVALIDDVQRALRNV